MKANETVSNPARNRSFDLERVTCSKQAVNICYNTIMEYHREGLPLYRRGRAVFFSKSELEQFIRNPEAFQKPTRRGL